MIRPQPTENEAQRLAKLKDYEILDTPDAPEYDDFTRIASEICGTPIALISLVDDHRQWFKSKVGVDATETPRELAFCAHAINQPDEILEVNDARKDERFHDNPLVTQNPHVIFYAGSPLVTPEGYAIGTLCVIDNKPREMSTGAKEALNLLGKQIVNVLELHRKERAIRSINDQLKAEIALRNKREEELIEARNSAIEGERVKDQFLSSMSHEIRTPLNGIIGITKLLSDLDSIQGQAKEFVDHIDFSAKHLLRIVNDILDFAKIRQEKVCFENTDFEFEQFMENLSHNLRPNIQKKNIGFSLNIANGIPKILRGDVHRLGQVLLNLAGNAIKFTEKGEVKINVSAGAVREGKIRLNFEICDSGIGISEEKIAHIFNPFTQTDETIARKYGGTGLGLPISKQLIEQMGGEIEVKSVLNEGSTFSFYLYFAISELDLIDTEQEQEIKPEDIPALNILLVEDFKLNQVVAKQHLRKFGFKVTIAENGREALNCLSESVFDVVLMDINMPVMDGLEATKIIRAHQALKDQYIIAMTASVREAEVKRCFDVGVNDFVSKPFEPKDLRDKILKSLRVGK